MCLVIESNMPIGQRPTKKWCGQVER